jgi:hypothetical protein
MIGVVGLALAPAGTRPEWAFLGWMPYRRFWMNRSNSAAKASASRAVRS